ncbi:hypothetical protein IMZ31_20435 (plasmid) [Pontibacillus sp. ALD_SL1]|uniref:hypothetical protein n=1 Tax=Pontibacillus sp. ALD_SL1 TaxID=2777185 RepID=UPI001A97A860|nr:hypothetical protein [Pontibacillus sp. ALD_SL1]QST02918.1 hypothetical protein IMZ31_20435 [Pontibacillus sp. ALD_SL1]
MRKVWLPLLSSFGVMALLYGIGNMFHVSLLRFSFVLNKPSDNGFFFEADVALIPIVIGLIVGFVVERKVKGKSK